MGGLGVYSEGVGDAGKLSRVLWSCYHLCSMQRVRGWSSLYRQRNEDSEARGKHRSGGLKASILPTRLLVQDGTVRHNVRALQDQG